MTLHDCGKKKKEKNRIEGITIIIMIVIVIITIGRTRKEGRQKQISCLAAFDG